MKPTSTFNTCIAAITLGLLPTWSNSALANDIAFPYSGRLVQDDGKPIDGPVDVVVEFYSSDRDDDLIAGPYVFSKLALESGVFQLNISLQESEFKSLTSSASGLGYIQIIDATNSVTYPRQRLAASLFALKVPVDNETIGWNGSGQLFLKKPFETDKIGGQVVETSGATPGQVLTWDADKKKWKPAAVPGSGSIGSSGLDDGAVTTNKLADGAAASTKIADQAVTLQKIADDSVNAAKLRHSCATGEVLTFAANGTDFTCKPYGDIKDGGISTGLPVAIGTNDTQPLTFKTDAVSRLTINADGKVGIGTDDPQADLAIAGPDGLHVARICDKDGNNCKDVAGGWGSGGSVTSVEVTTATGLSVTGGPITTSGSFSLGITNDLAAVEGLSGTGITVRTGVDTWGTITDNSTNWNLAHTDRLRWDGDATGLDAAAGRLSLGLQIGSDIQAHDAKLADLAAMTAASDTFIVSNGTTFIQRSGGYARNAMGAAKVGVNSDITRLESLQDNSLSGDKISGGSIDTFASTGINDNATATAMIIDATGQVGVGTPTPNAALDVAGSSGIRAEQICDESGANCKDILAGWSAADSSDPIFIKCTNANSRDNSNTACFEAATNGGAGTDGYRSVNCHYSTNYNVSGDRIYWTGAKWQWRNANVDLHDCNDGSVVVMKLNATGGSYTTQWSDVTGGINYAEGNVGISTPSPTAKLHIGGTAGVDGIKFPDGTLQTTATSGAGVPSGAVMAFDLGACPTGWADYAAANGRVIVGIGVGTGLTLRSLGDTGGEETHVLTAAEMPAHSHTQRATSTAPNNTWPIGAISRNAGNAMYYAGGIVLPVAIEETSNKGSDSAHNNMQPFIDLRYCKKS